MKTDHRITIYFTVFILYTGKKNIKTKTKLEEKETGFIVSALVAGSHESDKEVCTSFYLKEK